MRALRFFEEVEITERQGSSPDRAIVEVDVKEQPTGELSFSAGFSSADAFLVDLSITQRNLRGRGQLLRFVIRASSNRREVDLRFTEPRFLGRNLAAGVEVFDVEIDFLKEANFRQSRTGGQLSLAFPLTDYTSLSTRYSLRTESIESPGVNATSCAATNGSSSGVSQQQLSFCDQINGRMSSIVGYTFSWDRRNDPITPTRGFDFRFSQDVAGVGGDVQYLRSDFRANAYRGLFKNVISSASISGGYIRGWGGDPVSINDRYFKGNYEFRGYDNAGIGPRVVQYDANTGAIVRRLNSLGGNAFGIASAEVSFPVGIPNLLGSVFVEAGTVGLLDANETFDTGIDPTTGNQLTSEGFYTKTIDSLSVRAMSGLSIFWESPFGPIRFDFTKPLIQYDYDDRKSFQFTTRTRF